MQGALDCSAQDGRRLSRDSGFGHPTDNATVQSSDASHRHSLPAKKWNLFHRVIARRTIRNAWRMGCGADNVCCVEAWSKPAWDCRWREEGSSTCHICTRSIESCCKIMISSEPARVNDVQMVSESACRKTRTSSTRRRARMLGPTRNTPT